MVAGDSTGVAPSRPKVVRWVRCSGRVPQVTAVTGVLAARPPAMSRSAISPRFATPISTTMVPPTRAIASHSVRFGISTPSWPVTTVKEVETPRWVTGTPA